MKRSLVRIGVPLLALVGLLAAVAHAAGLTGPGTATTGAACCQLTTSLAQDALQGPDLTGDERFFMSSGAPPNIHFILDTSGSMLEPPITSDSDYVSFFSAGLGCSNAILNAYEVANHWDPATLWAPPDPGTGYGNDRLGSWDGMFGSYAASQPASSDTNVWRMMSWSDQLYQSSPPTPKYATFTDACASLHDPVLDKADYDSCVSCLQRAGYWFDPGYSFPSSYNGNPFGWAGSASVNRHYLMTANLLRFMPPKYVTAMATLKKVITHLSNVRAGITVYDGSSGGSLIQPQNPPCDLALRGADDQDRAHYVNAINNLGFRNSTPLAETLLNVGQYFSFDNTSRNKTPYDTVFGFGSGSWSEGRTRGYIKNGAGDQDFTNSVTGNNQNRSICWGCQSSAVVIITDGEPNNDDNVPIRQIEGLNGGEVRCPASAPCDIETSAHSNSYLDDVAKFLYTHDLQRASPNPVVGQLNTAGMQVVTTYGIALGLHTNLLKNAAEVGGGFYSEAHDTSSLERAIASIVSSVRTRGTTFSAASLSSLQVNRTGGSILPRFQPSRQGRAAPWDGFLYRFELGSEELFGCVQKDLDAALDAGTAYGADLNGDGTCDTVLLDRNQQAVLENDQGQFVLYSNPNTPAVPFWEASQALQAGPGDGGTAWRDRFIVTVVDQNGDGKIDSSDAPIEFTEANADRLEPYFGIRDADAAPCPDVAAKLGYADAGALSGRECAKAIIRWYRGADALNPDPAQRGNDQAHLLKDIFHSAPVTVEPPTPKAFCSFTNQCSETLFRTSVRADGGADAYDQYVDSLGQRDKVVLVGANDGMLHVFDDGTFDHEDSATGTYVYSAGTGKEELAFVPPDLLPKMRKHLGEHAFMVDDAAMVREAWIDLNGDGWKDPGEFRTLAIVNEGHGGVHHYALDLTDFIPRGGPSQFGAAMRARVLDPASRFFLWMWPQPCDEAALKVGESFGAYSPRPPPIGAVAIHDPDGHLAPIGGVPAREDWVVMFNGGYDPYLSRGRGVAMVELATGNTLWSVWGDPNASGPRREMRYPFAAGVSMVDIGQGSGPGSEGDYIFDTATVPDYGGNVWTLRFWEPGELDGGVVTNWTYGRAFSVSLDGGIAGEPMTEMTANALQPSTGYLRTFVGTGDRYHLTDTNGPHCRFSNPYACAEIGCGAGTASSPIAVTVKRGAPDAVAEVGTTLAVPGGGNTAGVQTTLSTGSAVGGNACAYSEAQVSLSYPSTCSALSGASIDLVCGSDAGTFGCWESAAHWANADPVDVSTDAGVTGSFYGFVSYGGAHVFEGDAGTSAAQYERAMLHPDLLTDVSANGATSSDYGEGWRVDYPSGSVQRTATGSAIVDSCVIWNTFEPGQQTGAICSTAGANTAHLYQANFQNGGTGCFASLGSQRSLARSVVAAPGDPTPQRQLINGHASSGIVTLEAGRAQGQTVSGNTELLQTLYQLDVPRPEHDCRHLGVNCE